MNIEHVSSLPHIPMKRNLLQMHKDIDFEPGSTVQLHTINDKWNDEKNKMKLIEYEIC